MLAKKKSKSIYDTQFMAWFLCLLAALFYSYDFLLRVQPNIFVQQLMNFYAANAVGIGVLYSAYYSVYTPLQIPAGLIIDRYDTRLVLTISALMCSLGALLFAEVQVYAIAILARILMGFGSAFAFIGALKLAAVWLPKKYFGTFSGIATSLGTLGALITNVVLPIWAIRYGWQKSVLISGYIGIGITILLALFVRSKPKKMKPLPHEFKNWGHAFHRLWYIAKQWEFWVNGLVGCLMFLPITVLAGLWGTTFLEKAYFITPQHAAIADAIIFIGMAFGGPAAGWVSDHMGRRKIPLYFGAVVAMLLNFALIYEQSISHLTLYVMLFFLGFFTGPQVLVFAIGKEISPPRTTGTASAGTNFLVTIGALIFAPLVGHLLVTFWDGSLSATGVPIYSIRVFRKALLVLPFSLIAAFILLLFVPETYCKMKFKTLRKRYS